MEFYSGGQVCRECSATFHKTGGPGSSPDPGKKIDRI